MVLQAVLAIPVTVLGHQYDSRYPALTARYD
jgi:hypothetical protein